MSDISFIIESALESNHRRIVVIEEDWLDNIIGILEEYKGITQRRYSILISGKEEREEASWATQIIRWIKENDLNWGYVPFKSLERIMGTTWDILIADFRRDLRPNDMGRLIEVVRGGGLIILLAPKRDVWKNMTTTFHKDMVVYPFTIEDIRRLFIRYIVESMESSPGIYFLSRDGVVGPAKIRYVAPKRRPIKIPVDTKFDSELYNMAVTQDEVEVISAVERLDGGCLVLTADRGRGKSAAIGIAIAGLLTTEGNGLKIVVTSPEYENVRELINFLLKSLHRLGVKYEYDKNRRIISLDNGEVKYLSPYKALREDGDILIVDEAAGIPVYILERTLAKFKTHVFSSTLHGYEGAGRGFQVRFLNLLRKTKPENLIELKMTEPIRYAPGDPIEKWLYDTLLLDSDPANLTIEDIEMFDKARLRFRWIDLENWIFRRRRKLKEYIGIYIYAHYRNRPNDIMILSDAPHHLAATVFYRGRVVNSLHLSLEGNMSRDDVASTMAGEPPSGHLIPTVIIRYYPVYRDFAFLRGIRIVRIATHPDLMGRGIGSYALDKVVKYAKEEGLDWIGSSFGATYELLSFWIKNGFFPIYLSPNRNPVSGEYSVIVIKPLTKTARKFVRKIRILFKKGLLDTLIDPHYSLDVKLAYQLLSEDPWSIDVKPKMDVYKRMKLRSYVFGGLTFSAAYDAIIPIVKNHFLRSIEHRIEVPKKYEYALISRVLQGKSWGSVASNLGMDRLDVMNKFRELIGRMRLRYLEAYEI